jgi:predicted RecA/RadA family phage recombinase
MSKLHEMRLSGTCTSDGALTVTGEEAVFGYLDAVDWIDGSFADGVDAVLSVYNTNTGVDVTLLTLTNADSDARYYPRAIVHSEAGVALTGTSGGDRARMLMNGVPKLAVTSGGDVKTGGCVIYWLE